jgi:hypothetical protein
VIPIAARVVFELPVPTPLPTILASWFWIMLTVESPGSTPCDVEFALYVDRVRRRALRARSYFHGLDRCIEWE